MSLIQPLKLRTWEWDISKWGISKWLKMSLIQPLKSRTLEMECFKMCHLQTPHLQMAVFQIGVTLASGHTERQKKWIDGHMLSNKKAFSL